MSIYKQFLASPSASLLTPDATLHYITTTGTIAGAENIIQHLSSVSKQIKKKGDNILDEVNGHGASAFQIESILEFVTGGGPYAPGLDDNFLSDHTVSVPFTHFVHYDSSGLITQIRINWDQGALLKQLDLIGRSGRNWPIRDNSEQIRMIVNAIKNSGKAEPSSDGKNSYQAAVRADQRSRGSSTLSLFRSREEIESEKMSSVVSPYAGQRPQQRKFEDIVRDEFSDDDDERGRSDSPSSRRAARARVAQDDPANRLFNEDAGLPPSPPPVDRNAVRVKPDPSKYTHFDFEDFNTPQKTIPTRGVRAQDVRHWDSVPGAIPETPAGQKVQHKARRDAEKHFEIEDDGPMVERPNASQRGAHHNEGLGLYENHVYREDGSAPTPRPKDPITRDQAQRQQDVFHSSYKMTDVAGENTPQPNRFVTADRQKAVDNMGTNWEATDESPAPKKTAGGIRIAGNGMGSHRAHDATGGVSRGIHIGGDGMGGPKGTNRDWLFGGDEEEHSLPKPTGTKTRVQRHNQPSDNWGF